MPLGFIRCLRLGVKINGPLPKLLSYVVPNGDPSEFSASVGEYPELLRVHRALCSII
jgi:hypothetical protein